MDFKDKTSSEPSRKSKAPRRDDLIVRLKLIADEGDFVELLSLSTVL